MIRQNLHTHSLYDDGRDPIDEMVQAAAEKGFTLLGFSGHGWNPQDSGSMSPENTQKYLEDVLRAKKNAPKGMTILLGIEEDSISPVDLQGLDYLIGSVHYLEKNGVFYPIDYSEEEFCRMLETGWNGDIHALSADYYEAVAKQAENPRIQIIGHLDLISKYNEDERYFSFEDPVILSQSRKAVERLAAAGKIFEMNTGAMARGSRTTPYPSSPILDQIFQVQGKLMINTDCHNKKALDLGIEDCRQRALQAGFKELYTFENGRFVPAPIEEFAGAALQQDLPADAAP